MYLNGNLTSKTKTKMARYNLPWLYWTVTAFDSEFVGSTDNENLTNLVTGNAKNVIIRVGFLSKRYKIELN